MAIHAVLEPLPARPGEVLVHRQGVDVAEPAVLEIARGGVVERVGLLPIVVWREREDAEDRPDDVGRPGRPEERGVAAVVLDDEQADEEEGGGHGQEQGEPVTDAQALIHERPRAGEQRRRAGELPDAPLELGALVARSEEHTSELQSLAYLVCRLLLEKK